MAKVTNNYIKKITGSKFPYYIRDVPKDVRPTVGKSKWKISLGDVSWTEANRKAREFASEHDALIETVRHRANEPDALKKLTKAEQERIKDAGGKVENYLKWVEQRAYESLFLGTSSESLDAWVNEGKSPIRTNEPDFEPDPDWIAEEKASKNARKKSIDEAIQRDLKTVQNLGYDKERLNKDGYKQLAKQSLQDTGASETLTLRRVLELWKEEAQPEMPEQYAYPLEVFEGLLGSKPIDQFTKDDCRTFRTAITKLPSDQGGKLSKLTVPQKLEKAAKEDLPRLANSTAKKHYGAVKHIFTFAASEGYIKSNPFESLKFPKAKESFYETERQGKRSISPDEMKILFKKAGEVWGENDKRFWFLKLTASSGARGEELSQLRRKDFKKIAGRWCFELHDREDNKLKNASSVRKIPLSRDLLNSGFMDFVNRVETHELIFELTPNAQGRLYPFMARHLRDLIRNKAEIDDRRVTAHSLRHTFKDCLRAKNVYEDIQELLMGHRSAAHRNSRSYGGAQMIQLTKAVDLVNPFDSDRQVSYFSID